MRGFAPELAGMQFLSDFINSAVDRGVLTKSLMPRLELLTLSPLAIGPLGGAVPRTALQLDHRGRFDFLQFIPEVQKRMFEEGWHQLAACSASGVLKLSSDSPKLATLGDVVGVLLMYATQCWELTSNYVTVGFDLVPGELKPNLVRCLKASRGPGSDSVDFQFVVSSAPFHYDSPVLRLTSLTCQTQRVLVSIKRTIVGLEVCGLPILGTNSKKYVGIAFRTVGGAS
jgi:hypothetical protein